MTRLHSLRPVCDWSSPTPLCSTLRRPRASTSSFIPVSYYRDCKRVSNLDREPSGYAPQPGPSPRKAATHGLRRHVPGCPTSTTGVPNKSLRRDAGHPRRNPHKQAESAPLLDLTITYRGPRQAIPGCPTSTTGVARQKLPGCPTNTTGVPNKYYRGARQKLPGCPTSRTFWNCCKTGFLCRCSGAPLFLFLL